MGLGEGVLELLFPRKCAFCGRLLEREDAPVCAACAAALPRTGDTARKLEFIPRAVAPLYYEGTVRRALLRYKFHAVPARGRVFGAMVAEELRRRGDTEFDLVTWAPLSDRRRRRRGYDQARILAEAVGESLGIPALPLLRKVRHNRPQSHLRTEALRRANVSGCYAALRPNETAGKRVLLVDDIITTGATVSECARMLLMAGADKVFAAAVACTREK